MRERPQSRSRRPLSRSRCVLGVADRAPAAPQRAAAPLAATRATSTCCQARAGADAMFAASETPMPRRTPTKPRNELAWCGHRHLIGEAQPWPATTNRPRQRPQSRTGRVRATMQREAILMPIGCVSRDNSHRKGGNTPNPYVENGRRGFPEFSLRVVSNDHRPPPVRPVWQAPEPWIMCWLQTSFGCFCSSPQRKGRH
jgi:hypothetical protein